MTILEMSKTLKVTTFMKANSPKPNSSKQEQTPGVLFTFLILCAAAAFCIMPSVAHGQSVNLSFAAGTGSSIKFLGTPEGGPSFQLTNAGANAYQFDGSGLTGSIINGPFFYGTVHSPGGGEQYASITTTTGELELSSNGTDLLTGTVNFSSAIIFTTSNGNTGGVNLTGVVDVTGLSYTGGSNVTLEDLAADQTATLSLSWQVTSGAEPLSTLSGATSPVNESYNISLYAVPEPSALTILVVSAGLLGAFRFLGKSRPKQPLE